VGHKRHDLHRGRRLRGFRPEQKARQQLEARLHGLKVRLGKARAAARRSETLAEKIALSGRVKEVEQEIRLFHKNYWTELERLEADET
jgi:hypothetical protein